MKQGQAASKSGTGIKTQTESPERQNKGALFDAQDSNQGSTPCYGDSGGPALVDFHGGSQYWEYSQRDQGAVPLVGEPQVLSIPHILKSSASSARIHSLRRFGVAFSPNACCLLLTGS